MRLLTSSRFSYATRRLALLLASSFVWVHSGCDSDSDPLDSPEPDSFELSPQIAILDVGETVRLRIETNYSVANEVLVWESSDPDVATVDDDGLVTAIFGGTLSFRDALITVTQFDRGNVRATATSTIQVEAQFDPFDTGVFDTCLEPEGINLIGSCDLTGDVPGSFGDLEGGCLATVACYDRFQVVDLADGSTVREVATLEGASAGYATLGLRTGSNDALFYAGGSGNTFCTPSGSCLSSENGSNDASPAGGDPMSGEAIAAGALGVQFIAPGFGDSDIGFGFRPESIPRSAFANSEPVSAWMPSSGGTSSALVLANSPIVSFLWEARDLELSPSPIQLGIYAQRIRCAEAGDGSVLCGVTINGTIGGGQKRADQVAVVHWPISEAPSLLGVIDVGASPTGLDIRARAFENQFAIVVTGLDGTITELAVSASKEGPLLLFEETWEVPAGCDQPKHAIYVKGYVGSPFFSVVGTCYGSAQVFVDESRI